MRLSIWATLFVATASPVPGTAACVAESGRARVHLVELYTSEGCSSCPPAEQWLSTLRDKPAYVGIEFHVDYWDLKDWHDPYADARYTARQKAQATHDARSMIYTPQIRVDGRLWREWPKAPPPESAATTAPMLKIEVSPASALHVELTSSGGENDRVYVAVIEDGLSNAIRGGENRGKTLHHDHVVRAFAGPLPLGSASADLRVPEEMDRARARVVAFVQDTRDETVSQVVPLPLGACMP